MFIVGEPLVISQKPLFEGMRHLGRKGYIGYNLAEGWHLSKHYGDGKNRKLSQPKMRTKNQGT